MWLTCGWSCSGQMRCPWCCIVPSSYLLPHYFKSHIHFCGGSMNCSVVKFHFKFRPLQDERAYVDSFFKVKPSYLWIRSKLFFRHFLFRCVIQEWDKGEAREAAKRKEALALQCKRWTCTNLRANECLLKFCTPGTSSASLSSGLRTLDKCLHFCNTGIAVPNSTSKVKRWF